MNRYSKEDESDSSNSSQNDADPFGEDDFSLDLQITDKFGKRTGKLYQPQKWKQNSEGFFDFEIQSNDTLTPESKMDKIRFMLGLQTFPKQSTSKQQSSEEFIYSSGIKIKNIVPQTKDRKKAKQTNRYSRESDLSLSFSVELDWQILNNIDDTETSHQDFSPKVKTNSQEKKRLKNKGINLIDDQQFPLGLKKSKSKQKRKQESYQPRNPKQKMSSGKNFKQIIENQNLDKYQRKGQNIKSGEQVKNENTKKPKESKNRFTMFQKEKQQPNKDKVFEPNVELGEMPSNFQEKSSLKKHFKDLSDIKTNENRTDQSFESNQSLKSFLNVIQNQPSYSETGELNRAVINIRSDNIPSDNIGKDSKQQEIKEKEIANHNKKNQQQKNKSGKVISNKNYKEEKSQDISSSEQRWTPLQLQQSHKMYPPNKDKKQSFFLSESLRKQAAQYYEQEAKIAKENQIQLAKEAEKNKFSKRERNFQTVQTNDILNYEKHQQLKEKTEHQKAFKKVKQNEPINEQKNNKSNQRENPKQGFSKNREDYYSKKQIQNSNDQDENNKGADSFEKQEQEQRIRRNNRLVKETDKNLKRKQKPQRASLSIKQKNKKSEKSNSQSRANSLKPKKLSKTKTQPKLENINDANNSNIQTSSEVKHKYPQRTRFPKMQYWNGQKIVYDREGKAKNMQTKELIKLIGFMEQTLVGQLQLERALFKGDRYIQVVTLEEKQTLDFSGFDERYSGLYIELKKKNKVNIEQLRKYIQVYQGGQLKRLNDRIFIRPNSGHFSIQNIAEQPLAIQFILIKNLAWKK